MGKAEEYERRAELADEMASKCVAGSDQQRQFHEVAEQWRALARQARTLGVGKPN